MHLYRRQSSHQAKYSNLIARRKLSKYLVQVQYQKSNFHHKHIPTLITLNGLKINLSNFETELRSSLT